VRRRTFIRKWRLKCKAVADSLEEAGDRLFTFTRLPVSQWKSARTTNAIERLHEEFKRVRRWCLGSSRRPERDQNSAIRPLALRVAKVHFLPCPI
jgi:Transposase, Mutator family